MIAKSQFLAITVLQLALREDGHIVGLPRRNQMEDDPRQLGRTQLS
jgi:hypothetical protein